MHAQDSEFLEHIAARAEHATGSHLDLPHADYLRLLDLVGLRDTAPYRRAVRDPRDVLPMSLPSVRWLVNIARGEG